MKKKILFFAIIIILITSILEKNFFPTTYNFSIISYNIHSGLNKDMYPTLFDIIDFLKVSNADVICIQEVNESAKVGFQVTSLKEELNMYSHFGANVVDFELNYGVVTYSKFPIKYEDHIYLYSEKEQRGILHTKVKIGKKNLNIINVHLGLGEEEREIQLNELMKFVEKFDDEPFIIVGDFNEVDVTLDKNIVNDVAKELNKANILTISTNMARIDYIFASKNIEIIDYEVLIENMSDHYPIIAKLKI
jgi:endonuclease/exonuclease/phosphatase family metal-dependent hydrolase